MVRIFKNGNEDVSHVKPIEKQEKKRMTKIKSCDNSKRWQVVEKLNPHTLL